MARRHGRPTSGLGRARARRQEGRDGLFVFALLPMHACPAYRVSTLRKAVANKATENLDTQRKHSNSRGRRAVLKGTMAIVKAIFTAHGKRSRPRANHDPTKNDNLSCMQRMAGEPNLSLASKRCARRRGKNINKQERRYRYSRLTEPLQFRDFYAKKKIYPK